jgi:hypothetical protein
MLRCYYCERYYYDMHPEWIDHVLDREKDDEDTDKAKRKGTVSKKDSS